MGSSPLAANIPFGFKTIQKSRDGSCVFKVLRTNLLFKNVTVGSKSRGNKQLADIKVIFRKGNLFLSSVDFCQ